TEPLAGARRGVGGLWAGPDLGRLVPALEGDDDGAVVPAGAVRGAVCRSARHLWGISVVRDGQRAEADVPGLVDARPAEDCKARVGSVVALRAVTGLEARDGGGAGEGEAEGVGVAG